MTFGVTTAICLSSTCVPIVAYTEPIAEFKEVQAITPWYIAILTCSNKLTLVSSGKLNCQGSTAVQDGYMAEVLVELQCKNGSDWSTIKSWSSLKAIAASVNNDWNVERGIYRLQLTHYAKTSSGSIVDSVIKYSDTVTY